MSKGMRLFIRRMLWWKGPSDSYFFWGGVSLLACSSAPFALFLTNASHTQPPFIGGGRSCWRNFVEPYRCEWGLIKLKIESGKLRVVLDSLAWNTVVHGNCALSTEEGRISS